MWSARKIARLGMLLALATALHLFEAQLPALPIPGAKIGLANLVSLFVLYAWGFKEALLLSVMRQIVGSFVTGTLFGPTFLFGLSGGLLSIIVMAVIKSIGSRFFGPVAVSLFGATAHNVGQLLVAWALLGQAKIFYYLPYLLWFAIPSGALVGVTTVHLLPMIPSLTKATPQQSSVQRRNAWVTAASIALIALVIASGVFRQTGVVTAHTHAQVSMSGQVVMLLPLDQDQRHVFTTPHGGRMVIETSSGRVRVAESTCDHQVCVRTGWIDFSYQSIVCLPFQVIITLVGDQPIPSEFDAVLF